MLNLRRKPSIMVPMRMKVASHPAYRAILNEHRRFEHCMGGEMGGYRAVMACFFAVVLTSCVTTSESPSGAVAQADDAAIPPNYRELIIQTISARTNVQTIRSARIKNDPAGAEAALAAWGL
jgi:hypothetical protein